jgi:hypothetical protein
MNSDALAANALHLLGILAIVLANGFFVAAEFAFVKLRDTQLDALIVAGNRRARLARHILRHLTSYLSATQLGITMASLGLGWLAQPVFLSLLGPPLQWLGVARPTSRIRRFRHRFHHGHLSANRAGRIGAEMVRHSAGAAGGFGHRSAAALVLPRLLSVQLAPEPFRPMALRRVGIEPSGSALLVHSEEELRLMLNQSRAGATRLGHEIILNALDLSHRIVRNVMRPRMEIAAFNTEASLQECLELAEKPAIRASRSAKGATWTRRSAWFTSRTFSPCATRPARGQDLAGGGAQIDLRARNHAAGKTSAALFGAQTSFCHCVDEYGGTVGMVTLENVLEELVGQIQDEFDQEKPLLMRRGPDQWEIDGALPCTSWPNWWAKIFPATTSPPPAAGSPNGWAAFPKAGDA